MNQGDSDRSRDRLTTKFSKDHSFTSPQYVAVVSLQEGVIEKLRFWFGLKLRKLPFGKDPEQTSEKCVLFFFMCFMIIVHLGWNLVRERIKWRHRVALFIVTLTDETQVSNQRQNFRCTY